MVETLYIKKKSEQVLVRSLASQNLEQFVEMLVCEFFGQCASHSLRQALILSYSTHIIMMSDLGA